MSTALVFEPATSVPVTSQIWGEPWHDHDVADTRFDPGITPGADVRLAGLVGLNGVHCCVVEHQPKNPHATNARIRTTNTTTSTMSVADRF